MIKFSDELDARRFYQERVDEGLWTLEEAWKLYNNEKDPGAPRTVRADISPYAGGVTWVDRDYDETSGERLCPLVGLAEKHRLSGKLKSLHTNSQGEHLFLPKDIINFIQKNVTFLPPLILHNILFPQKGCIEKSGAAANAGELAKLVDDIIKEHIESGEPITRESLYKKVNQRLKEGKVTMEWAKLTHRNMPQAIRKKRGERGSKKI
jgi:hypothetical protein